jgi:hypothetical protein
MKTSEPDVAPRNLNQLPLKATTSKTASVAEILEDKTVRDIRSDLEDRADWIEQQIKAQQAQFENLIAQLKKEQRDRIEDLKPQLQAVTTLLRFATWHHDLRMTVARALALAATAEITALKLTQTQKPS